MVGFFTVLLVCGLLAKLVDGWLRKSEKDKLTEKLTRIWQSIDNSSLTSVSQAPLRAFSLILDIILGDKIFTGKAFRRTAILSTCVMVVSLSVGGISVKTPFALKTAPWTSFDEQMKAFADPKLSAQTIQKQQNLSPQMLELLTKYKNFLVAITKCNTTANKVIYSLLTIILILLVSILIYVVSFAFSRMMVREAMEANTPLLMASIFFLNLCIGFIAEGISFLLISSANYSLTVLSFAYYIAHLPLLPTRFPGIILSAIALTPLAVIVVLMWFLSPPWIKIMAAVAILPMICLILVLFISWLLFPFRKQIRHLLSQGLSRALEHEKGIFILISITFSCIGGIAVAIAKLF
jgi:hypothetical protein